MKAKDQDLDLHGLCNRILESDRYIRFVGIPNKMGKQIVSSYNAGLIPLLTPWDIENLAMKSVLRMKILNQNLSNPYTHLQNIRR